MTTLTLPIRKVKKLPDGHYVVLGTDQRGYWIEVSNHYAHSTSAFAALGRLVQKDTLAQI